MLIVKLLEFLLNLFDEKEVEKDSAKYLEVEFLSLSPKIMSFPFGIVK